GTLIDDAAWTSVVTPRDMVRIVAGLGRSPSASTAPSGDEAPPPLVTASPARAIAHAPAGERRVYDLNMPQMALGRLAESLLLKEIGDVHWSVITRGLGIKSSLLSDAEGNRLYATFTRVCLSSTAPLAAYGENETITIDAKSSRYGAGMFF